MFDKRISIQLKDISLSEALNEVAELADISFSYSSRIIPRDYKVTFGATNLPLSEVLDRLFLDLSVEYVWVEGKVIIRKSRKESKPLNETYTISGYIVDQEDGETLIGGTVLVE
ncbi:MAG: hypothetical protein RJQ14_24010, partial [Marinoscillum sp.]